MVGQKRSPGKSSVVALELRGEIDVYRRPDLVRALDTLKDADIAVVDLTKVAYFDLTLITCLVHLKNQMSAQNAESVVRLVGAKPNLKRVFEITQLAATFEFRDGYHA